ncbi:MAG: AbrB/MazE/SpoVT family DNA-binding domain-containing protein [Candidatus Korobacteraceae bacterium]
MNPVTTKMSSRGQVVIPERIREQLSLEPGAEFVVVAKGDALVLQRLSAPSWKEFDSLIREARRLARQAGLTPSDVKRAIAKSRKMR